MIVCCGAKALLLGGVTVAAASAAFANNRGLIAAAVVATASAAVLWAFARRRSHQLRVREGGAVTADVSSGEASREPLRPRFRAPRGIAGLLLLALVPVLPRGVLRLAAGWLGATHLVAAATGYPGCLELGAVPSLLTREDVYVGCGPWRQLDALIEGRSTH